MAAINIEVNKALAPFLTVHRRFKIIYGGRGSSKSMFVAMCMGVFTSKGEKVCCFREQQNSLEESVKNEIQDEIIRLGMTGFTFLKDRITHESGGYIIFRGMSRNPSALKSMKGFTRFWLEEGQDVSAESLRVLTPTLREAGGELWITANPKSVEDELSQRFIERELQRADDGIEYDDLYMRLKINFTDNRWFPPSLEDERLDDYKRLPRALYDHIWLGAYNDSVENSVIQSEWFDSAIDSHKKLGWKPVGAIITAHDPADTGDARAVLTRHGNLIIDVQETTTLDINESCDWAMNIAKNHGADHFVYDAVGCGLALKRQVEAFWKDTRTSTIPFMGGAAVENPDKVHDKSQHRTILVKDVYKNLRAQKYFQLAERFQKTYQAVSKGQYINPDELISISSDVSINHKFKSELCRIPQIYNMSGQFQVMSKHDMMSKLKLKSPNMADCATMSYVQVKTKKDWGKPLAPTINFA